MTVEPLFRLATADDGPVIEQLTQASIAAILPASCEAAQTASSIRFVGHLDPLLGLDKPIEDLPA